jgi:hypothetical protein
MYGSIATWRTLGLSVSRSLARADGGAAARRLSVKLAATANPALVNVSEKALSPPSSPPICGIDIFVIYEKVYY